MLKIKAIKGRVIIFKNRKLTLDGDIGNEYEISKEEFQKDKEMQSVMKYLIINNINSNVDKKDTKKSIIAHDIKQESIKNVVIKQPEIIDRLESIIYCFILINITFISKKSWSFSYLDFL